MCGLPPVCHILKDQELRVNIRLGAIGVSPGRDHALFCVGA